MKNGEKFRKFNLKVELTKTSDVKNKFLVISLDLMKFSDNTELLHLPFLHTYGGLKYRHEVN